MKTYKLGKIEIFSRNLKPHKSWSAADRMCKNLGEGWRLPSIEELKYLFEFYNLGLLNLDIKDDDFVGYWSDSINGSPTKSNDFDCEVFYYRTLEGYDDIVWEPGFSYIAWEIRPVRSIV
jgi:hypothetical protein